MSYYITINRKNNHLRRSWSSRIDGKVLEVVAATVTGSLDLVL